MNMLRLALATLAFVATGVAAADHPAALAPVDVNARTRLVIECADPRLPPLRAIAGLLDTNNASLLYAQRERLVGAAYRECRRGAASVAFVRDNDAGAPGLAMTEVAPR